MSGSTFKVNYLAEFKKWQKSPEGSAAGLTTEGTYFNPSEYAASAFAAGAAAEVAELRAPMECGHPRACETFDGLIRDKEGRVHRCAICVELSTLKAQCAAILEKTVAYIRNLRKTPGGLDLYHTEIQILGRIADGLGKVVISTDHAAALAEKIADAIRTRDYEWFKALGYQGEPTESTLERIVAAALAEHDEQLRQKFSNECVRFHEEGHKCVTCGREDIEELKAQCAAVLEKADDAAWLIERGGLCLGFCEYKFRWVTFTDEQALRFSRKIDAYNFVESMKWQTAAWGKNLDGAQITEHSWPPIIPTDYAAALEEVKRQARAAAQDEIRIHIGLFMPINDDEEHYQRGVLSIIDALRAEGAKS